MMKIYGQMAKQYEKLISDGKVSEAEGKSKIKVYSFLSECDKDDLFTLTDTGVLNDIIKAYSELAIKQAELSDDDQRRTAEELHRIFDELHAKTVYNKYIN